MTNADGLDGVGQFLVRLFWSAHGVIFLLVMFARAEDQPKLPGRPPCHLSVMQRNTCSAGVWGHAELRFVSM